MATGSLAVLGVTLHELFCFFFLFSATDLLMILQLCHTMVEDGLHNFQNMVVTQTQTVFIQCTTKKKV